MNNQRLINEHEKEYFHGGDIVVFKDLEGPQMKVIGPVFSVKEGGGRRIEGIKVQYPFIEYDENGNILKETYFEKIVDSRSIHKVERKLSHLLHEAKVLAFNEKREQLLSIINEALTLT